MSEAKLFQIVDTDEGEQHATWVVAETYSDAVLKWQDTNDSFEDGCKLEPELVRLVADGKELIV